MTHRSTIHLSPIGCIPDELLSSRARFRFTQQCQSSQVLSFLRQSLENKDHHFCPLESNVSKKPFFLSITPTFSDPENRASEH